MASVLHDAPRQKLRELIAMYGRGLCEEPARCRGFLLEMCGEYRREIIMLMLALEEHVVADMLDFSFSQEPYPLRQARLTKYLCEECGLTEEVASWSLESWARALSVYSEETSNEQDKRINNRHRIDDSGPLAWRAFGTLIRGVSHIRAGTPNQDAILWQEGPENGLPLILALADGHSDSTYYRSDRGAKFAVEVAVQEMTHFFNALLKPLDNIGLVKQLSEQLPKQIVVNWRKRVMSDVGEGPPFTQEEWRKFPEEERGAILAAVGGDKALVYGATLLTVLVTESFILYLQLGDGDILMVTEAGQVTKPLWNNTQLLANEITSLSSTNAIHDFRKQFHILQGAAPALILLSTAGYASSFTSEDGFLRVGSDILHIMHRDGVEAVKQILPEWLNKTSEVGNGDDITLGVLCRLNIVDRRLDNLKRRY